MSNIDTTHDQLAITTTNEGVAFAHVYWRRWLAAFYCFDAASSLLFTSAVWVIYLAPAISTYINERSPETQRATIFSLQTGLFSAAMIVLFPLFGLGITRVAYSTVYLWTLEGLIIGSSATGVLAWILNRRAKAARKSTGNEARDLLSFVSACHPERSEGSPPSLQASV